MAPAGIGAAMRIAVASAGAAREAGTVGMRDVVRDPVRTLVLPGRPAGTLDHWDIPAGITITTNASASSAPDDQVYRSIIRRSASTARRSFVSHSHHTQFARVGCA